MMLSVQIVEYIDDHQPGICKCKFTDAWDKEWVVTDKVPIFTPSQIDHSSKYPQAGAIRCQVVSTWQDAQGREIITISTLNPDDLQAITGENSFDVLPKQLGDR